ncbi:hypothetical protein BHE74_00021290 [Ensete ventricosum]|nr:hypothetical protein BHE74_00021290 [Ensete ventricosum]
MTAEKLLKHLNLGDYLSSKLPSLKQLQNGKKNGDSKSTLLSLAKAMQALYKLPVRGPSATGRFHQKSIVSGRLKGEKGKNKKRKKKKKKRKEEKKEYLSLTRGPHPCAVAARGSPAPARRCRPRVAGAFSPAQGERSRRRR